MTSEKFTQLMISLAVEMMPPNEREESDRIVMAIKAALDSAGSKPMRNISMLRAIEAWRSEQNPVEDQRLRNTPTGRIFDQMQRMFEGP